jgi:TP53 regulating kinase-like protein
MEAVLSLLPANTTVIGQGAEAIVGYLPVFVTSVTTIAAGIAPSTTVEGEERSLPQEAVVKQRFAKIYRHPRLDVKLTQQRVKEESKMMVKCLKEGIDCPVLYHVDVELNRIFMEKIEGITLKQFMLNHHPVTSFVAEAEHIKVEVGRLLAKLHAANIVHGDLTTSNIMVRDGLSNSLALIDFGLSYSSTMVEDKAVDLYVLERAFISTHPDTEEYVWIFFLLSSFFFLLSSLMTELSYV